MAKNRDPVATDKLTVEDASGKFAKEWQAVKASADVFGQGVKRLCSDAGFYRELRQKVAPVMEKAKDALTEAVKLFLNVAVDGWPSEGDTLVDRARTEIERVALEVSAGRQSSTERRAAGEALYGLRGVQRIYLELKNRADDFLRNYKGKESPINDAITALQGLSRNVSAPGQADDAQMLYTVTFSSLIQLRDDYVRAMDAFVAQHAGNVKTAREAVGRQADWSCVMAKIHDQSLRADLYTWRRSVANYFDVDLSRLGKWRDRFQSALRASIDGSIIVTDRLANAVVRVDAPGQAACAVTILAGSGPSAKVGNGLNAGDKDGEGSAARFSSPTHPAVDDKGNVYVIDNQNKLRRIAADAGHTVSTVAALPTDSAYNYSAMTYLAGKLYATYLQARQNTVFEIDPASGHTRVVLQGNGAAYPPFDSSVVPALGAIASDGTQLYITGKGRIWSLTPDGKLAHIAGSGKYEFAARDNVLAEQPARGLALPGNAGNVDMAFLPGSGLLFRGRAGYANNSFVVAVSCP